MHANIFQFDHRIFLFKNFVNGSSFFFFFFRCRGSLILHQPMTAEHMMQKVLWLQGEIYGE